MLPINFYGGGAERKGSQQSTPTQGNSSFEQRRQVGPQLDPSEIAAFREVLNIQKQIKKDVADGIELRMKLARLPSLDPSRKVSQEIPDPDREVVQRVYPRIALAYNRALTVERGIMWQYVELGGLVVETLEGEIRSRGEELKELARQHELEIEFARETYKATDTSLLDPVAVAGSEIYILQLEKAKTEDLLLAAGYELIEEEKAEAKQIEEARQREIAGGKVEVFEIQGEEPSPLLPRLIQGKHEQRRASRFELLTEMAGVMYPQQGQEAQDIPLGRVLDVFIETLGKPSDVIELQGKSLQEQYDKVHGILFDPRQVLYVLKGKLGDPAFDQESLLPAERAFLERLPSGNTPVQRVQDFAVRLEDRLEQQLVLELHLALQREEERSRPTGSSPRQEQGKRLGERIRAKYEQSRKDRYDLLTEVAEMLSSQTGKEKKKVNLQEMVDLFLLTTNEEIYKNAGETFESKYQEARSQLKAHLGRFAFAVKNNQTLQKEQTGLLNNLEALGYEGNNPLERLNSFRDRIGQWMTQEYEALSEETKKSTVSNVQQREGAKQEVLETPTMLEAAEAELAELRKFFGPLAGASLPADTAGPAQPDVQRENPIKTERELERERKALVRENRRRETLAKELKQKTELDAGAEGARQRALFVFEPTAGEPSNEEELKLLEKEGAVTTVSEVNRALFGKDPEGVWFMHELSDKKFISRPPAGAHAGDFKLTFVDVVTIAFLQEGKKGVRSALEPYELENFKDAIKVSVTRRISELKRSRNTSRDNNHRR